MKMYKAKIFIGMNIAGKADEKFNSWIENHPDIYILQFEYQQTAHGEHSICILYKEKGAEVDGN